MDTDWIQVGSRVAEYDFGAGRYGDAVITTVTRVTGSQITCATGHVFRRDTGYASGAGRGLLLPLSDSRVVDAAARTQLAALPGKIEQLCRDAGHTADEVLTALDRVDQAVKAARTAIQRYRET